ncbi:MAG TPA: hypothetical protein ENK21_07295 [Trueperaceae bacterium]|nr:hypothetical protein [Trueperaceae bacterium]
MSRYEALLIRFSLLYLILTALFGFLFYLYPNLIPYFKTSHIHAGILGFFLSMVMGVAYWMMPRPKQLRQERLEAISFYLLNSGLLLRLIFEPWWLYSRSPILKDFVILSGALLLTAVAVFAIAMNARVVTAKKILALRAEKKQKTKT